MDRLGLGLDEGLEQTGTDTRTPQVNHHFYFFALKCLFVMFAGRAGFARKNAQQNTRIFEILYFINYHATSLNFIGQLC